MKPRGKHVPKSSKFLRKIQLSLCVLLAVSRERIFRNSSSPPHLIVCAFPLLTAPSPRLSSTKICSCIDDKMIGSNSKSMPSEEQLDASNPQRRIFLGQAAQAATAILGGSVIMPTKSANAIDTESKLAKLTNAKISAEGATMVIRKAKGGGLAQAIRVGLRFKMDELQRDLMQERWDLLQPYPAQLRSYVYIFTTYTDAAFPSDSASDKDLRVSLRYEVGRFYGSLGRLQKAISKQELDEAYMGELVRFCLHPELRACGRDFRCFIFNNS